MHEFYRTCKVDGCVDWRGVRARQRARRAEVGWLNGLGTSRFDDPRTEVSVCERETIGKTKCKLLGSEIVTELEVSQFC